MAKIVVVAGKSATGKSTAYCPINLEAENIKIKGLNPKETFLFNVVDKEIPVPLDYYTELRTVNENGIATIKGNKYTGRDYKIIYDLLAKLNESKGVKNIIIEDAQYLMSLDFFDRRAQDGYNKFAQIGFSFIHLIMEVLRKMRSDIVIFLIIHTDEYKEDKEVFIKLKTIGKMLDEKFTLAGLFSIVAIAQAKMKGTKMEYTFRVRPAFEGDIAKSLLGMFIDDKGKLLNKIPNDFGILRDALVKYYKIN